MIAGNRRIVLNDTDKVVFKDVKSVLGSIV